jgi:hypothetical protein
MNPVLLMLILAVVLAAAIYSRLPITTVSLISMMSLMISMQPHGEPLQSVVRLLRVPADAITSFGSNLSGLSPPWIAGIFLLLTLAADMTLTNALGVRR